MIQRHRDLDEVFDPEELMTSDVVPNYQLIRGVLAASAKGGTFCVLCDARRPDLIEDWYAVMRAVRSSVLRCRLQLLTWGTNWVKLGEIGYFAYARHPEHHYYAGDPEAHREYRSGD
jgi:hypothetical protein